MAIFFFTELILKHPCQQKWIPEEMASRRLPTPMVRDIISRGGVGGVGGCLPPLDRKCLPQSTVGSWGSMLQGKDLSSLVLDVARPGLV